MTSPALLEFLGARMPKPSAFPVAAEPTLHLSKSDLIQREMAPTLKVPSYHPLNIWMKYWSVHNLYDDMIISMIFHDPKSVSP